MEFLRAQYERILHACVKEGLEVLRLANKKLIYDSAFLQSSAELQPITSASPIVFSVPGSGKTQYIFDFLSHQWGHYIVSGRVPRSIRLNTDESFFNARQGSASSDTRHLNDILELVDSSEDEVHTEAWACLVMNRNYILNVIFDSTMTKEKRSHFTPRSWLLFQTSCTQSFDPFLRTFQVRLLLVPEHRPRHSRFKREDAPPGLHTLPMYFFCLDEAQCELDRAPGNLDDQKSSPLKFLLQYINEGLYPGKESQFIASGTALKLDRFKQTLEDCVIDQWRLNPGRGIYQDERLVKQGYKASVYRTSQTVDSDDDFEKLLKGHVFRIVDRIGYLIYIGQATRKHSLWEAFSIGPTHSTTETTKWEFFKSLADLLKKSMPDDSKSGIQSAVRLFASSFLTVFKNDPIREKLLSKASKTVQGQIRWSTLLVERLLIAYVIQGCPQGDEATQLLGTISTDTQNLIKDQLKSRIKSLKSDGQYFLLRDLFLTAVRANLMNKPSVFPDIESVEMVTEGFALLKSSEDEISRGATTTLSPSSSSSWAGKQELAEPIVIKAVIEYLHETEGSTSQSDRRSSRLERVIEELLFSSQNTEVGDIAEIYLAWGFASNLRKNTKSLMFPERRQNLLTLIENADLITRCRGSSSRPAKLGDVRDYFLHESESVEDIRLESNMDLAPWLKRIRNDEYFPAVLFPPHDAGPDIVFMLQHQSAPTSKILCALQASLPLGVTAKTGATKVDSFGLLRTLDPNLWYSGKTRDDHQSLSTELGEWGPNLRILTGLILPTPGNKVYEKGPASLTKLLQDLRGPAQLYTSLATENEELERQKIIKPLIADLEKQINEIDGGRFKPAAKIQYWSGAIENKLGKPNDHRQQSFGAESFVRIAVQEIMGQRTVLPIFNPNPRAGLQGQDFYFTCMEPQAAADIFGEYVGRLLEILRVKNDVKKSSA
ncbi:hypothetical protein MMC07_007136 [Pseudocyphellaria aurata]|nr:hypothetical protein [Pseudocyphellaria aurata]